MGVDDALYDRETKTGSRFRALGLSVYVPIEHERQQLRRNASAGIGHCGYDHSIAAGRLNSDTPTGGGELDSVLTKIQEQLAKPHGVSPHAQARFDGGLACDTMSLRERTDQLAGFLEYLTHDDRADPGA